MDEHQPQSDEESELWRAYAASRDAGLRIRLIERHLNTAQKIAAYLYARRGDRAAEFDDYLQYARLGLIEALDRYDPSREASFATFASYRIRGAVLNGLERASERAAQWSYRRELEQARAGSLEEGARGAEGEFEELVEITIGLALGYALEDSGLTSTQTVPDPYQTFELKRLQERLRLIVDALPERERAIVKWHYFEHMDFKLIGLALGLSKGRISQLHSRALQLLRKALETIDRFDVRF
jgi:RNA polymerase sigma factor FliA